MALCPLFRDWVSAVGSSSSSTDVLRLLFLRFRERDSGSGDGEGDIDECDAVGEDGTEAILIFESTR